jgi:glycerol-3-phosphate acyltransferase PlsY
MDLEPVRAALLVLAGYLAGSSPMGVVVARVTRARDPRTVGSGRTGGTNALRAMGFRRAVTVAVLDIGKGAAPVLVARLFGADEIVQALVGIAAVIGAWRSVFLGFQGGRGLSTGIGAMLVIQPVVVLVTAPVFFAVIALSRYVSLGSLLASAAAVCVLAIFVFLGVEDAVWLVYAVSAALVIWLAHADNIERLARGQEQKFSFGDRDTR